MSEGAGTGRLHPPGAFPALVDLIAMPHFALSTTTRCQQKCAICFEGAGGRRWDVPAEDVERQIREASRVVPGIVFMGGESTLHPGFVDRVGYAANLGLAVAVSSNLQRFADQAFLMRCVDAGLNRVEGSFSYPDAAVFETMTGTPARRFERLLRALDNLESVARNDPRPADDPTRFAVNVNVVVCSPNVSRLHEVLVTLSRHMPTAFRLATFKRLETVKLHKRPHVDPCWVPAGAAVRAGLQGTLDGWAYPGVLPVLRDFPLCVAPDREEHHVDLLFHGRHATVAQNFGPSPDFAPMHGDVTTVEDAVVLEACERCSLVDLCHAVTRGRLALHVPGLDPRPSAREPQEVLLGCGLDSGQALELRRGCQQARDRARRERAGAAACPAPGVVERLVRRMLERVGRLVGAPVLERAEREHRDGLAVVTLVFRHPDGRVVLHLSRRVDGRLSFSQTDRFMVTHAPDTPLGSEAQRQLARAVLITCEKHLE